MSLCIVIEVRARETRKSLTGGANPVKIVSRFQRSAIGSFGSTEWDGLQNFAIYEIEMVGACGFEPQTPTVSTPSLLKPHCA
jgi:hypothetical protein